jgi:hypothetical protein
MEILFLLLALLFKISASSYEESLISLINRLGLVDLIEEEHLNLHEISILGHYNLSPFAQMIDLKVGQAKADEKSLSLLSLASAFERDELKLLPSALSLLLSESESKEFSFQEAKKILRLVSFFDIKQTEKNKSFAVQKGILEGILGVENLQDLMFEMTCMNPRLPFDTSKMEINENFPFPMLVMQLYAKLSEPLKEISIRNIFVSSKELQLLATLINKNSHLQKLQLISLMTNEKNFDLPLQNLLNLSVLELRRIKLSNNHLAQLTELISKNTRSLQTLIITDTRIGIEEIISHDLHNLIEFNISGNFLEPSIVSTLEKIISQSVNLHSLSLNSLRPVKSEIFGKFFQSLQKSASTLRILRLKNFNFRDKLSEFQNMLAQSTRLEQLELQEHPVLSLIDIPKSLKALSIDSISVSKREIDFMCQNCSKFKHLKLTSLLFELGKELLLDEMLLRDCVDSLIILHDIQPPNPDQLNDFYSRIRKCSKLESLTIPFFILPIFESQDIPNIHILTISISNDYGLLNLFRHCKAFPNLKELNLHLNYAKSFFLSPFINLVEAKISRPFTLRIHAKFAIKELNRLREREPSNLNIFIFVEC